MKRWTFSEICLEFSLKLLSFCVGLNRSNRYVRAVELVEHCRWVGHLRGQRGEGFCVLMSSLKSLWGLNAQETFRSADFHRLATDLRERHGEDPISSLIFALGLGRKIMARCYVRKRSLCWDLRRPQKTTVHQTPTYLPIRTILISFHLRPHYVNVWLISRTTRICLCGQAWLSLCGPRYGISAHFGPQQIELRLMGPKMAYYSMCEVYV